MDGASAPIERRALPHACTCDMAQGGALRAAQPSYGTPGGTGARPRRLLAALVTWHNSTACSERRPAAESVRAVTVLIPCAAAVLHRRWL